MDSQHRTCVAVAWSNYIIVKIRLTFPPQYPNNVTPIFQIIKPTNIRHAAGIKLVNVSVNFVPAHLLVKPYHFLKSF